MITLKDNPVIQLCREIISQAVEIKEAFDLRFLKFELSVDFDLGESDKEIKEKTYKLLEVCGRLEGACPPKVLSIGSYNRHVGFIRYWLNLNKIDSYHGDILSLIHTDIFAIEEKYFHFLEDSGSSEKYFNWTVIHPVIKEISKRLFDNGHYGEAVRSSFIEINDLLKQKYKEVSGKELDGQQLMQCVFASNPNNDFSPIFSLADNSTSSGQSIQDGYKSIFAGVMSGIRNPNAHANIEMDPDGAWDLIVLASHLLKMVSKNEII